MTADRESEAADMFARHKAQAVMRSLVTNLKTAASVPYVSMSDAHSAIICGAGPSLAYHGDALRDRLSPLDGVELWAVNAGAPALEDIDVLVVRESIDVSTQIEGAKAKRILLDVCANPRVWEAALRSGARCEWFMPASVQNFRLARLLGVIPTYAGPAAITAAVALAEQMGVGRIALVGVDLCFVDGQGYAPGSGWGDIKGEFGADGMVRMTGMDRMRSVVSASGQHAPPEAQRTETFPGVDGSPVRSLATWGDQVRWLEQYAARCDRWVTLSNCSSGVDIQGWERVALDQWIYPPSYRREHAGRIIDTKAALEALEQDAAHALDVQKGNASPRLTTGVIEAMSAGGILEARDAARGNPEAAIKGTWAAYAASGEWVLSELRE
jgi:hypothetical protein